MRFVGRFRVLLKASNIVRGWSNVRSKESYKKTGLTVAASQRVDSVSLYDFAF